MQGAQQSAILKASEIKQSQQNSQFNQLNLSAVRAHVTVSRDALGRDDVWRGAVNTAMADTVEEALQGGW